MTSARETAEQRVAARLGIPVEELHANERAEMARARELGERPEQASTTYLAVQRELYALLSAS